MCFSKKILYMWSIITNYYYYRIITNLVHVNVRKNYIFRILEASSLYAVQARHFIVTKMFGIYKITITIRCNSNIFDNIGNISNKQNRTLFIQMKFSAFEQASVYVWVLSQFITFRLGVFIKFTVDSTIWSRES